MKSIKMELRPEKRVERHVGKHVENKKVWLRSIRSLTKPKKKR